MNEKEYLLIIEGDINDADYVYSHTTICGSDLPVVKKSIEILKAYQAANRYELGSFENNIDEAIEQRGNGGKGPKWAQGFTDDELRESVPWVEDFTPRCPVDGGEVHSITEVIYYELVPNSAVSRLL